MITTLQAARLLGVQRVTIIKWIRQGKLQATKLGRDWTLNETDLHKPAPFKRGRKPKQGEQEMNKQQQLEQAARRAMELMELDIAADCRWCGGEGGWETKSPTAHPTMTPVKHKPDCPYMELRTALAAPEPDDSDEYDWQDPQQNPYLNANQH